MVRRFFPVLSVTAMSVGLLFGIACIPQLSTGDDTSTAATTTDAGTTDGGVLGGGCGTESTTGIQLCEATTMCPAVVVDTTSMPNCGFRLRNGWAELVCVCGTSICPFGEFDTCDQVTALLTSQTQAAVCTQVADGRCEDLSAVAAATTSSTSGATTTPTTTTTTSASSSASSGGTGCDTQCVKDCGGGAACASVCNCS